MSKRLFYKTTEEDGEVLIFEYVLGERTGDYSIHFAETTDANSHVSDGTGVIYESQDLLDTFLVVITNRRKEYELLNQNEMQYDDIVNGTTIWQDTILSIKEKFPLPTA